MKQVIKGSYADYREHEAAKVHKQYNIEDAESGTLVRRGPINVEHAATQWNPELVHIYQQKILEIRRVMERLKYL